MDLFDLSGTTAIVTGGNSGIGFAGAEALCRAGARVSIWGSNSVKTKEAALQLGTLGYDVLPVTADVAEEADVIDGFTYALSELGRLDTVLVCAGVAGLPLRFGDLDTPEWHRVAGVNTDGAFYTLREGARHLLKGGHGGSMIVVSSVMALRGQPRAQAYAASKAAVCGMVRSAAVELGAAGIRVNAVLPGYVVTALAAEAIDHKPWADRTLPRIPLGRWGDPSDIAGIIQYLAAPASRWHTGDTIVVDGGYSVAG